MIQRTSILLLALAALMGLTGMELYIFSPGRIIACIAILLAGERRSAQSAAETGICCTAAMAFCGAANMLTGGIYTACGYWAGLFAGLGRIRQTMFFAGAALAASMVTGFSTASLLWMLDLLVGCGIFLLLPDRLRQKVPAVRRGRPIAFADAGRTARAAAVQCRDTA